MRSRSSSNTPSPGGRAGSRSSASSLRHLHTGVSTQTQNNGYAHTHIAPHTGDAEPQYTRSPRKELYNGVPYSIRAKRNPLITAAWGILGACVAFYALDYYLFGMGTHTHAQALAATDPQAQKATQGAAGAHTLSGRRTLTNTQEIAEIANAARQCCNGDVRGILQNVTDTLAMRYPGIISPDEEWLFMRAGGWMGAFKLLYASVTEYVLLFGTAVDTSGHSGRYWADISDTILTGRFVQWDEGSVVPVVHGPGVTVLHPRWTVTGVQWDSGTWMLEHATGFIPSTMGFAFSDGIFSTQDFWTLAKSTWVYARLVVKNLLAGRL